VIDERQHDASIDARQCGWQDGGMTTTLPLAPADADLCCTPVVEAPLGAGEAETLAAAFKVLADPARLRLLSLIAAAPDRTACNCDLIEPLGLSQPTVSHHLKVLTDAGFLQREKRAQWAYYRVVADRLAQLRAALDPAAIAEGALP
jgi:ArsR family transcriptional regulator